MALSVGRADATTNAADLATLLWTTDPKLNGFMFPEISVLQKVIAREWPESRGLLSHAQAFTAVQEGKLLGFLVGHTSEEYAANFQASLHIQTEPLQPSEADHMHKALYWMDRLFPAPRENSYYILEFAITPKAQGRGLAPKLLEAAEERARGAGCAQICLDVAADNEAVGFYEHLGFSVEIETRVPFLQDVHGIGLHLHMARALNGVL